jgi:hypothetical protein
MSDPWIDIEASQPDTLTVGDALADLAVEHCRERDAKIRPAHVRARLLHEMHEGCLFGKAWRAADGGEPDYDRSGQDGPPLDIYGDWERMWFTWGRQFYDRVARARGWRVQPAVLEQRSIAFGSALASLTRHLEHRCLLAGQNERMPALDGYGGRDSLLDELASGKRREHE